MKNLLFDEKDLDFLKRELAKELDGRKVRYTIVILKEMQPNKDTLRIVRENKLLSLEGKNENTK